MQVQILPPSNYFNKMKIYIIISITFLCIILFGCSEEDNSDPETLHTEKLIFSFEVTLANPSETIHGKINEEHTAIELVVPNNADVTSLTPYITQSAYATVSPGGEQDFSNPVIYTVTAQDGTTTTYEVIVKTLFESQKETLIDILNANPQANLVNWNSESTSFTNWVGVYVNSDGEIYQLNLPDIITLPSSIDRLSKLTNFQCNPCQLSSLPSEIGSLNKLEIFLLNNSDTAVEIPGEFSELQDLKIVILQNTGLNEFPPFLFILPALENLVITGCNIQSIPEEIGSFTQLKVLNLSLNPIVTIPKTISGLTQLEKLYLDSCSLTVIPAEVGELSNLTELKLTDNDLTSLPSKISQLTNLDYLYIADNNINSIPQSVCNMEINYGTVIYKDIGVTCYSITTN